VGGSLSTLVSLESLVGGALACREPLFAKLEAEGSDCYRLFHGAAEGRPGLAVDRYGEVLLVQTWRDPLGAGDLAAIEDLIGSHFGLPLSSVWNHRGGDKKRPFSDWHAAPDLSSSEASEGGLRFAVDPRHGGRDPLFFLDFRAARRQLRSDCAGCTVLNLFAYTCTVGVAALAGDASSVLNVDFARSALAVGRANASRNGYGEEQAQDLCGDALLVTRQLAGLPVKGRGGRRQRFAPLAARQFDRVVLDPPRWATSRFGAVDLVRDYPGVFKPALLATRPGGKMLVANNVAAVALDDWLEVLERCASKAGRPIQNLRVIPPDDDFPSFDGQHPLKLAWLDV
jgi:23S rRNA (cytosine1962-C5)-methyltransferase